MKYTQALRTFTQALQSIETQARSSSAAGHTVVIDSHSVRFLKRFADKLAFMGKSELIEMNATRELLENPKDERTREFLRFSELS